MMFSPFERTVAWRYLRARRQEGFISVIAALSVLGIALGVGALIVVMAVMDGFRHELLSRVLEVNGHLMVYDQGGRIKDFDALAKRIGGLGPVVRATPMVQGRVMAISGDIAAGAVVRGLSPADLKDRRIVAGNIRAGTLDRFKGKNAVILGARLAEKLGVGVGDRVTLVSPQATRTAFGAFARQKRYRVIATFEIGMFDYDDSFIYMPLEAAQIFFRFKGAVTGIEVALGDPRELASARAEIASVAGPDRRLFDWRQAYTPFLDEVRVQRNMLMLVLGLMIVVAAFNIVSGLNMLVKDKRAEIGILRTMGATRGMVMRIFLLNSLAIGVAGTAAGVGLAMVLASNIEGIRRWIEKVAGVDLFSPELYFLAELPARIQGADVAWVAAMALGISLLATLYPSWRAASLDPVETLRYG